jgi:hypothetical protein
MHIFIKWLSTYMRYIKIALTSHVCHEPPDEIDYRDYLIK